ncbi:MarR family winged helix-turn-helix transcriptional regulator [Georgenia alba]|uniref:MarR family winged helix-turn-helix transcriptional regulator n=1 Tax=Georgenia alba TaxID=2233858 RepID=A0ABW2QDW5_9MICO
MAVQAEVQWLDEEQQRAWRNYLRGNQSLLEHLNRDLEESAGLSLSEYEVLVRLSEAEGRTLRMSVLAEDLVHSRSRLTHEVRRLEAGGYVERRRCEEDGRGVTATLTDAGMARLAGAAPGHVASVRARLVDRLTAEQLRQLGEIMSVLADGEDIACPM